MRKQRDLWPDNLDLFCLGQPIRRQFLSYKRVEIGAMPARVRKERMGPRQRLNAALDGPDILVDGARACQPDNRLHDSQSIAGAVVDFARQQILPLLGLLTFGDVNGGANNANAFSVCVEDASAFRLHPTNDAIFFSDGAV